MKQLLLQQPKKSTILNKQSVVKYSIIIISYENFPETTGQLLNYLLPSQSKYEAEVILFDNGSTAETLRQIKLLTETDERLKVICNHENLGFAGGNNQAFTYTSGEVVIFLNSDTITTFPVLDRLIDEMSQVEATVIGPISNQVSGVQKIKIFTSDVQQILNEGEFINNSDVSLEPFETDCLSFFCIAIKRDIYSLLNGLDEGYEMGYYEDADFCFRARKAGMKLHCTERVFVYHKGEGSFANVFIKSTILKNKKRFKKHHKGVKSRKVRIENLDRIRFYKKQLKEGQGSPGPILDFLFSRRFGLTAEYKPKSFLTGLMHEIKSWTILKE